MSGRAAPIVIGLLVGTVVLALAAWAVLLYAVGAL